MRKSMLDKTVTFLATALFSTALMAGDPQRASTFESLDKNSDQQISKSEAQSDRKLADGFASADTNGDGYLNKSEFKTVQSGKTQPSGAEPASPSS